MSDDDDGLRDHMAKRQTEHRATTDKKQASHRFATINHFVDVHMNKCKPSDVGVYLAIWRYVRDGYSEIGRKQIAEITGYSERQVTRSVKALLAMGAIEKVRQGNNLMKKPNMYRMTLGDNGDPLQTLIKE